MTWMQRHLLSNGRAAKRALLPFVSWLVLVALVGCEPAYRKELQAGDKLAATQPEQAAAHYQAAVKLGAELQGNLALARLAERHEDWKEAARYFGLARAVTPKDVRLTHSLVRALLEAGERGQAQQELLAHAQTHDSDREAVLLLAALAQSKQDAAAALPLLQKGADDGAAHQLLLAELQKLQGEPSAAPKQLAEAVRPGGELLRAALVLAQTRRKPQAARLLQAATAKYRHELILWLPLLQYQVDIEDHAAAEKTLEQLPTDVKSSALGLELSGRVQQARGDALPAVAAFRKALDGTAETDEAERLRRGMLLAHAQIAAKQDAAALDTLKTVLVAAPEHRAAQLAQAAILLRQGKHGEAVELARAVTREQPKNDTAQKLLVGALMAAGKAEEAVQAASSYVAAEPQKAFPLALRAKLQVEQKRWEPARADLRRALELEPTADGPLSLLLEMEEQAQGYPGAVSVGARLAQELGSFRAYLRLGSFQNQHGQALAAVQSFKRATEISPKEPEAWRVYATQLAANGDFKAAAAALETLLTLRPQQQTAYRELSVLQRKMGDAAAERKTLERWLTQNPNAVLALNNLAASYTTDAAQLDRAVELAQRAHTLQPKAATVADTLGWALLQRGKPEDVERARELLKSAAHEAGKPVHHYHYAVALSRSGDAVGAKRALEQSLQSKEFAERAEAQKLLSEVSR